MRIVLASGRNIDSALDYLPSADAFDMAKRTPGGGAVITTESRIHAPLGSYNIGQTSFTFRVVFKVPLAGTYLSSPHVFSLAPTNVGFSAQTLTGFIWADGKFMLRLYGRVQ